MPVLQHLLIWWRRWRPPPPARSDPTRSSVVFRQAFAEQAPLLVELDLLRLAQALQQRAQRQGGYQAEVFDLMLSIADRLEQHHGWDPDQCDAWLERLGVWG